jgi:hypothetical protein
MYIKKLIPFLVLTLLMSVPAVADTYLTVKIPASQDTTLIDDAEGARSNGTGPYFFVGRTGDSPGGGIRRGLIQFDLEGIIPEDAHIEDVALYLYASNDPDVAEKVRLLTVQQDWGEGASCANGGKGTTAQTGDATWLHTFFNLSSDWDNAGGDWTRPATTRETVDMMGGYVWSSNRMKKDVQLWAEQPETNFGWVLIGDERTQRSVVAFASRESFTCGANGESTGLSQPMLEVSYSLAD